MYDLSYLNKYLKNKGLKFQIRCYDIKQRLF